MLLFFNNKGDQMVFYEKVIKLYKLELIADSAIYKNSKLALELPRQLIFSSVTNGNNRFRFQVSF